ncbi:CoA pyrophosphatase [Haloactinopolyspora sp.]|uniref:NUDIX hydrolase n=1 Tax=Haloactinopolyspora sp. TaxID=1966353 RepID=UPI00261FE208|nr:CoA pyrophosphatase [Haloactinopolyspora sp.]
MTRPQWLRPIVAAAGTIRPGQLSRFEPPPDGSARPSAVLVLFGESDGRPDVLLTERAHGLRRHPGQAAFPGGVIDPSDDGPVGAALREGQEETGLDPAGVDVITTLPAMWIPVTNYSVTPVLAWWREPSEVRVVDAAEVASVHRVPLAELLDPANRMRVRHPSGAVGPAFHVRDLLVWGFTAGVLSRLFEAAGIDEPWDRTDVRALPDPVRDDERSFRREGRGAM